MPIDLAKLREISDYSYLGECDGEVILQAANELEALRGQYAAAIEVLRLVEWADYDCGDYFCPVCHGGKNEGHVEDCKLALLLCQPAAVASGEGE
jgi:hypothetical protein